MANGVTTDKKKKRAILLAECGLVTFKLIKSLVTNWLRSSTIEVVRNYSGLKPSAIKIAMGMESAENGSEDLKPAGSVASGIVSTGGETSRNKDAWA